MFRTSQLLSLLLHLSRHNIQSHKDPVGNDSAPRTCEALDLLIWEMLGNGHGSKPLRPANRLSAGGELGRLPALESYTHCMSRVLYLIEGEV